MALFNKSLISGRFKQHFLSLEQLAELITPPARDGKFGSKVGQIGPKWDKFGAFSDHISVQLARGQNLKVLG